MTGLYLGLAAFVGVVIVWLLIDAGVKVRGRNRSAPAYWSDRVRDDERFRTAGR